MALSSQPCHIVCQIARQQWLSGNDRISYLPEEKTIPHGENDQINSSSVVNSTVMTMERVEAMYRMVLDRQNKDGHCCVCGSSCEMQREANEKLAMILLQSGRHSEADKILDSLGFTCRLSRKLFNYDELLLFVSSSRPLSSKTMEKVQEESTYHPATYCKVFDDVLDDTELQILQTVYCDIHSSYWTDHNYSVEPPSPYYSYILPLHGKGIAEDVIANGTLSAVIHRLHEILQGTFVALQTSTCAEVWAHNRPHATGHQFHFDSDNEGNTDVIRNPIVSCVLYLSSTNSSTNTTGGGGPTVVTNQRLSSRGLASKAWIVPATKSNRLVAFDGKLLHGVVPGSGSHNARRVSLMVAFWKKIRVRQSPGSAACQWPALGTAQWADTLMAPAVVSKQSSGGNRTRPCEIVPIIVSPVYETVPGGLPWSSRLGVPDYELIFQGM